MKKTDLFNEEPPSGHDDKVRRAVTPHLDLNREVSRGRSRFWNWKLVSAAAGGFAALALVLRNQSERQEEAAELTAFQMMIDGDDIGQSVDEFNAMSDENFDLELLEDLDFIEEMEEV